MIYKLLTIIFVIILVLIMVLIVAMLAQEGADEIPSSLTSSDPETQQKPQYLGPAACASCHREKYDSFLHTAHNHTSSIATNESIKGPLTGEASRMLTSNAFLFFEMLQEDQKFYQQVRFRNNVERVPIDIVTGSGKMGQTYLSWRGELLFQNHVSYFRETDSWINSPGYADGTSKNNRPITPRCLECHVTAVEALPGKVNRYRRSSIIYGVSCERCHGEGGRHVEFHRNNPEVTDARFITNARNLSRERSNDVCAQCHSGISPRLQRPFSFRPGKSLSEYFSIDPNPKKELEGRVHTDNQLRSLKKSVCFQSSKLTCADCHNPHQQERRNLVVFSKRCLNCHETKHCGMSPELDARKMEANCIDCHMPLRHDTATGLADQGTIRFPLLRDHHVRIDKKNAESLKALFAK